MPTTARPRPGRTTGPRPPASRGVSTKAAAGPEAGGLVWRRVESPIGPLTLIGDGTRLTGLAMDGQRHEPDLPPGAVRDETAFGEAVERLDRYFAGAPEELDLPVDLGGGPFSVRVWQALRSIPYGETVSYGELARRVGAPGAARAVGGAVGRNPVAVVLPCHRVVGADGSLTGFGGGMDRKRFLLALERGERPEPVG